MLPTTDGITYTANPQGPYEPATTVTVTATVTAAGFIPVAYSGAPQDGETSRQLTFENPNSPLDDAGV